MTGSQRAAQVAAAHDAVRGTRHTDLHRLRIAAARERPGHWVGCWEPDLAGWLTDRGIPVRPQQPVGHYNLDLGCFPVAVEVFSVTCYPLLRPNLRQKTRHLIDAGWHVIWVWTGGYGKPVTEAAADYIAAYWQTAYRNPSGRGEYRVIRGTGKDATRPGFDFDK
jgi:hypothetical protein